MSKYIIYIYSDNFYVLIREKKNGISADYNKYIFNKFKIKIYLVFLYGKNNNNNNSSNSSNYMCIN